MDISKEENMESDSWKMNETRNKTWKFLTIRQGIISLYSGNEKLVLHFQKS